MTFSTALLIFVQAINPTAATMTPARSEVVIVGSRDAKAEAALAACLKQVCPPGVDANASLRVANAQFASGRYDDARATLNKALQRARRAGDDHPKLLAALYQAQATVAQHQGDISDAISANARAVSALERGEGPAALDTLAARLDLANIQAQAGRRMEARRVYRLAAQNARSSGQEMLAYVADMMVAWLNYRDPGQEAAGKAQLTALSKLPGENLSVVRIASAILLAQIGREHDDPHPTDRLLAMLAQEKGGEMPILLSAEALPNRNVATHDEIFDPAGADHTLDAGSHGRNQWVDVGYWIRPRGNVEDVQILRGSAGRDWLKPILPVLGKRLYSTVLGDGAGLGIYHVSRLSLGHAMTGVPGSLIRRRAGKEQIEELDLAQSDWPAPPQSN